MRCLRRMQVPYFPEYHRRRKRGARGAKGAMAPPLFCPSPYSLHGSKVMRKTCPPHSQSPSISRNFYQEICLKFSTCNFNTANARKGGRYSRFHACAYPRVTRTYGSLGATGGSIATRRCSYTAAFKLKVVEYAETRKSFCAITESGLSQCGKCAHYIE